MLVSGLSVNIDVREHSSCISQLCACSFPTPDDQLCTNKYRLGKNWKQFFHFRFSTLPADVNGL